MAITYSFKNCEGYLLVTTKGTTENIGDILQYAADIASELSKRDLSRVLIDETQATIKLRFHEALFNLKAFFEKSKSHKTERAALVCDPYSRSLYIYLQEKIAHIINVKTRIFTDMSSAEEWIQSP